MATSIYVLDGTRVGAPTVGAPCATFCTRDCLLLLVPIYRIESTSQYTRRSLHVLQYMYMYNVVVGAPTVSLY